MNIKPNKASTRDYAKYAEGGEVDDPRITQAEVAQPEVQQAEVKDPGTMRSSPQGHNELDDDMFLHPEKYEPPLPRSGKGTARVSFKKYPGWPQMG